MKKQMNLLKNGSFKVLTAVVACSSLILSCDNDDNPVVINEEEVITTMNVTLTANGNSITLQSQDLDGDGPNPPVITVSDVLEPETTYAGTIELLNETESPAENITTEVAAEADEHQFFFGISGDLMSTSYGDEDGNGNPLGIKFSLVTGETGSGTLQITLRHEPKKPNDGSLADAGGETDIAQSFPLEIM